MMTGRTCAVLPSGSPAITRACCSNWLQSAASSVQWPELCGRGAISLASSRPSSSTKNSMHRMPRYSSRSARLTAAARACSASAGETAAGTVLTARMPCRCSLAASG